MTGHQHTYFMSVHCMFTFKNRLKTVILVVHMVIGLSSGPHFLELCVCVCEAEVALLSSFINTDSSINED